MAYSSCIPNIAANIAMDCSNPPRAGFTGEGVLIDLDAVTLTSAVDASDPRIITSLAVGAADNVAVVDNKWRESMIATITQNTEGGRVTYDKALPIRIPARSAAASKNIVEPLGSSRFIGVFPTIDQRFIVLGFYGKLQASEVTQSEGENGGDFAATLSVNEPFAVVELLDSDYATTKLIYDALVAKAF